MRHMHGLVRVIFGQNFSKGLFDLTRSSDFSLLTFDHFPLEVVEGVYYVIEELGSSEVDADQLRHDLKVVVLALLLAVVAASEPSLPLAELNAAFEESAHELVNLPQFEHAVIIDLEHQLLRPDLLELSVIDHLGVLNRKMLGPDNVGIMRKILPLVERTIVILNVISLVDCLQH